MTLLPVTNSTRTKFQFVHSLDTSLLQALGDHRTDTNHLSLGAHAMIPLPTILPPPPLIGGFICQFPSCCPGLGFRVREHQ